nr:MAG TPA: hypothetical protein [Caudoviricetes sp.]
MSLTLPDKSLCSESAIVSSTSFRHLLPSVLHVRQSVNSFIRFS